MSGNTIPKLVMLAVAALFAAALASPVLAHPGGGAGGGMGGGAGMGAGMNTGMNPGGMSSAHMSTEGMMNTNGPDASDRDTGTAHAMERMNDNGLKHNKIHSKKKSDSDSDSDNTTSTSTTTSTGTTPH